MEGRNLRFDHRWAAGNSTRIQAFAKALVALQPDVIVGHVTPAVTALRKETSTIPWNVPTIGDFVPGYEASGLGGIGAPKGTPAEIINKLNREVNAGLADAKMKARLADMGYTVLGGSLAEYGKLIAEEVEKWAKVIKFAGAKPE